MTEKLEYQAILDIDPVSKNITIVHKRFDEIEKAGDGAFKKIGASAEKAGREIDSAGKKGGSSLGKMDRTVTDLSKSFGKLQVAANAFIAVFAIQKIAGFFSKVTDFIGDSIDLTKEQIRVEEQLDAVLASTGNAAGLTATEIKNMASELQGLTNFGDEATIAGQNILLTFTNIGRDVFPQATETMLDMSTALGQDLKSSAIQLGKALNDPIGGISALSRVGVQFTQQQKDQAKAMIEAGDVAGAQGLILAELQREFGGSAKAAREADGGLTAFNNAIGDLQEVLAKPIFEEFSGQFSELNSLMSDPEAAAALSQLAEAVGQVVATGQELIGSGILESLRDLDPATIQKFSDALDDLGAALSEAFGGEVKVDLNLLIDSLTILIDIGTTATNVYNRFSGVLGLAGNVFGALKDVLLSIVFPLKNVLSGFSALNDIVEQITGARLVDFSRDMAEASETSLQATEKAQEAAAEIANLSAQGPGRQAPTTGKPTAESPIAEEETGPTAEDILKAREKIAKSEEKIAIDSGRRLADIAKKNIQNILDLARDSAQRRQDIATANVRKIEDIERQNSQAVADAVKDSDRQEQDLARKQAADRQALARSEAQQRADIERDTAQKIADIRSKVGLQLDQAANQRDAVGFLQLQQSAQQEIQQAQTDRERRIEETRTEGQRKREELSIQQEAERQQLNIEEQRRLEDLRLAHERRLEEQRLANERAIQDQILAEQRKRQEISLAFEQQKQDAITARERAKADLERSLAEEIKLVAQAEKEKTRITAEEIKRRSELMSRLRQQDKEAGTAIQPRPGLRPFAEGGSFRAGDNLLVGERGPEIMTSRAPGNVIPNHALPQALRPLFSLPTPASMQSVVNNTQQNSVNMSMLDPSQVSPEQRMAMQQIAIETLIRARRGGR